MKRLLLILIPALTFAVPRVGDVKDYKILWFGIGIAPRDVSVVCRYVDTLHHYAVWTPYQKLNVVNFFNGKTGVTKLRTLVFSKFGYFVYNPVKKIFENRLPSECYSAGYIPLENTSPYYIVVDKKIYLLGKNTLTVSDSLVVMDFGDILQPYFVSKKNTSDTFYVATEKGIYRGFGNPRGWQKIGNLSDPIKSFVFVGDSIIAGGPFALYLWDKDHFTSFPGYNIEKLIKVNNSTFYVLTPNGVYYFDISNLTNWNPAINFYVSDMKIYNSDTLLFSAPDSGVYFYSVSQNKIVYHFPNTGLEELKSVGAMNINSVDFNLFGDEIYVGTELGAFVFKNGKWNFVAGYTDDPGLVGGDGLPKNLLGFNVESALLDTAISVLNTIFIEDSPYVNVKKHFNEFFGRFGYSYPDKDNFDGLHIVLFPLYETSPDQSQGYYPDIKPVLGYFSESFYKTEPLKEAITLDPLEFIGLPSREVMKAYIDYLLWRIGIFGNKDFEEPWITIGFGLALAGKYGDNLVFKEGLIPDSLHARYLHPYVKGFYENPNRDLRIFSSTHPTIPDPAETDKEKLYSFFSYLVQKYDTVWAQILYRRRYTGVSLLKQILSLKGDTFENEIVKWRNSLVENKLLQNKGIENFSDRVQRVLERYAGMYIKINEHDTLVFDVTDGDDVRIYKITTDTLYEVIESERIVLDLATYKAYVETDNDPSTYEIFVLTNVEPYPVFVSYGKRKKLPEGGFKAVLLQNPGIENVIHIYGWNDMEDMYVDPNKNGFLYRMYEKGTDPAEKPLIPVTEKLSENIYIYRTSFTLNNQGTFIFDYVYQDKSGNMDVVARDTISVFVLKGGSQRITLWNGELDIYIPENSVYGRLTLYKEKENELAEIGILREDYLNEGVSRVYVIGKEDVNINKEFYITLRNPLLMDEGVNLYMFDGERWVPVSANIDRSEGVLFAKLSKFGMYQLRKGEGIFAGDEIQFVIPSLMNANSGIKFFVPYRANIKMEIYSVNGRKLTSFQKDFSPGIYILNDFALKSGVYFVKGYVNGNERFKKKFIYFVK